MPEITDCDLSFLESMKHLTIKPAVQPSCDVIVCDEMDELWGYVGAK